MIFKKTKGYVLRVFIFYLKSKIWSCFRNSYRAIGLLKHGWVNRNSIKEILLMAAFMRMYVYEGAL